MSYFADLSPYVYTATKSVTILNIGWLDATQAFTQGKTSDDFRKSLQRLCDDPIILHRGFHACQFCPARPVGRELTRGNGQIRVMGKDGIWYAAPTMVYHYVTAHDYLPPPVFIQAVLKPTNIWREDDKPH